MPHVRTQAQAQGDLLIPIVKGWCTEFGVELASTGIQVHGGTGLHRGDRRRAVAARCAHHRDL